ncbi:MAG TPA: hypothetical protein VGL42_10480 [Opitutaceae bacterium]|jgi:hypothetical protein
MFEPCPHLPPDPAGVDWRHLNVHRDGVRGGEFYVACLEYAQRLWVERKAARAMLCLDRALGADLTGDEPELTEWPLPYLGMAWIMAHTPPGVFLGNPRIHFQHYGGRMNEPRKLQRQWRAWACWALARVVFPDLAGDPLHLVDEPSFEKVDEGLRRHGISGEHDIWLAAVSAARCFAL